MKVYVIILLNLFTTFRSYESYRHRVAVIGGGIGGTSSAYFLSQILKNASIVLYEPFEIGGRLSTSKMLDKEYETGGAIIHPANFYMATFVKQFDLQKSLDCERKFGLFDGKSWAFYESNWSLLNLGKLVWRYGIDLYYLKNYIKEMLHSFSNIYNLQIKGIAFKSVTELLQGMNPKFVNMTKISTKFNLKNHGFKNRILDELVTACLRTNYGQSLNIHSFVGSVSLAGAGSELWSVKGGNKRVAEELLKKSDAELVQELVTKIVKDTNKQFTILSKNSEFEKENNQTFDAIVLAIPITSNDQKIEFVNFEKLPKFPEGSYKKIISTLIQGKLNSTYFHTKNLGAEIDEILTINPLLPFNSVGQVFPVDNEYCNVENQVYKIFSPDKLSQSQLGILFDTYRKIETKEWLAYPEYPSKGDSFKTLADFELFPGIYFNNAIEWAASAMEMSVIAAMNNALLVNQNLVKNYESFSFESEGHKEEL